MKPRHLVPFAILLAAACGGESTPPSTTPTATASAPSASAPAAAPSASAAAPAASDAAPVASAATATPPPPAAKGSITGTVTSMPASAAKNAVIYLEDGPKDAPVNVTIDNKQMSFLPYIAIATVGATVTFANSDPFPHNIFSPDGGRWDIGQIAQHASKTKKFDKPMAYTLLCNLHPNMKGYLLIVPSSAHAKANAKGAYTIKDVPAGTYKITAWAPGVKPVTQSVTVAGDVTSNFELKR